MKQCACLVSGLRYAFKYRTSRFKPTCGELWFATDLYLLPAGDVSPVAAVVGFLPDDVDHIVSLAYNYGVTLLDLDQTALAERFLCRAMTLLTCASAAVKGWLPRIQVSYAVY
jgi:hypothetical protein